MNGPRSLLAAGCAAALAGCTTMATLDPKSDGALKAMSDQLAGADQLSVSAYRRLDRQLIDNPNMIGNAAIEAQIDRPDRAKAVVRGSGEERRLYLGKDGSTIHSRNSNFYAQFPGHPTIEKACDAASAKLGIHIPMQDFLSSNPYREFKSGSDTIEHAGVERAGGQTCDHLMGSRDDLEWHLWISQSSRLPVRYTITAAGLKGKDHLQLDFKNWNLAPTIAAGTFDFTPPKGSREIEFLLPGE